MRPTVAILDLGAANRCNVQHALLRSGADATFARTRDAIDAADALVLPGVANVGHILRALDDRGLRQPLLDAIASGKPLFAICAGFQMLYEASEEAPLQRGLGVFCGTVRRLTGPRTLHVGWNVVRPLNDRVDEGWAYFAHSFAAPVLGPDVCATSAFGDVFAAASGRGNILGVQFHPERSGAYGASILRRFVASIGRAYAC